MEQLFNTSSRSISPVRQELPSNAPPGLGDYAVLNKKFLTKKRIQVANNKLCISKTDSRIAKRETRFVRVTSGSPPQWKYCYISEPSDFSESTRERFGLDGQFF